MRLSTDQITAIKAAAREAFGPDAVVRLFGSRVDDYRRGGDIDLHVEASPKTATIDHEVRFRALLWKALDEPQVDVVVAAVAEFQDWRERSILCGDGGRVREKGGVTNPAVTVRRSAGPGNAKSPRRRATLGVFGSLLSARAGARAGGVFNLE